MLFERLVNGPVQPLIRLSQLRQDPSPDAQETYITELEAMKDFTLKEPVLFTWFDKASTCWLFERIRAHHELAETYVGLAKEQFTNKEHKATMPLLKSAMTHQLAALDTATEWTWKVDSLRSMPELNPRYLLARTLRTKAFFYHNMYMFQANLAAIQRAYQLAEISGHMWKKMHDEAYNHKLLCLWCHMKATEAEEFEDRISYSTKAAELDDPMIQSDHAQWLEQNDKVYFKTVKEVSPPPALSVAEAIQFVLPKPQPDSKAT